MAKPRASQIRIIAGQLRGSKLPVPSVEGLRPTPDRIRETLFNWCADDCRGAAVLDCFAGSGALGFEAASREAAVVTMIEKDKQAWQGLQKQLQRLRLDNIEAINGDALEILSGLKKSYDLVFIDPPYAQPELRSKILECLVKNELLNEGARIYLEWPHREIFELPQPDFTWWKQKKAGQVHYAIAEWRLSR